MGSKRTTRMAQPNTMPTIGDVATLAGVSKATVSRVLSGNYPVARPTRTRVLDAVAELDYSTNVHARALTSTVQRTLGVIIGDIVDPYFSYIVRGIEHEAALNNRFCIITTVREPSGRGRSTEELAIIDRLREQRTDAVIAIGGVIEDDTHRHEMAERARALADVGSTLVICDRPPFFDKSVPAKIVRFDNEGGAFAITEHLIAQGHRRILFLGGPTRMSNATARLQGYRRALIARGIEATDDLIHMGSFGREFGYSRMTELLRDHLSFTAVFAANDFVAVGALEALRARGLRVPEDISLVGYDDTPPSSDLTPKLTTVHVPLEDMGRETVRLALKSQASFDRHPSNEIILGTHIVTRESTAPPRCS